MILEVALTNKFEETAWVYGHLNKSIKHHFKLLNPNKV